MGVNYSAKIRVGFLFDQDEIKIFYKILVPGVSHDEPRFDPKTGKRTGSVVVHDKHEEAAYVYEDIEEEDIHDFTEAFAEKMQADVHHFGDDEGYQIVISPIDSPEEIGEGKDYGRFDTGGHLDWLAVSQLKDKLESLSTDLARAGLTPREPLIVLAASCG